MNKKGFTLIELLAVVTLIALISIIAIPNITRNILNKKNEISEANQKLLAAATETYIENNQSIYSNSYEANGSTYCIPVQTLIDNGILEKPFKNINGQEIDYSSQVQATYQAEYNSFNYELVNQDECQEIKQYVSRPQLKENMIPVIYDNNQNAWVKADPKSHWYNYSEKKWANAVLVKELKETENSKNRNEYMSAPTGTKILEQDILAQFVWIPRFRYQLFESNTQTPINIVFEDISTQKSTGTQKRQWLTHPAFTYNNIELSGIWVGKYETSIQNNNIIIKNQTGTTNIDYVEANKKIIQMTNEKNIYGLKNINTHMTRNSEWGAIAYLTNSIYGNLENNSSTGNQTGIYNLSGNKEFVIQDNQNESSLGYSLNETSSWTTNNSYITDDNLYLTRGNNSIFNYQNSSVIDENTTFRIVLTNIETQDQNYQKKYIVTLDPDGGTLSETTKEISYHEPYGSLPTPTKEGYTFMGWNGKNMFNYEISTYYTDATQKIIIDNEYAFKRKQSYNNSSRPNIWPIFYTHNIVNYQTGKKYTISFNAWSDKAASFDSKTLYIGTNNITTHNLTTITPVKQRQVGTWTYNEFSSGAVHIYPTILADNNYYISNIQIEEGTTVTEYEPYYITPSTPVVQQKNHTLKAIWQANS